MHSMTGFGGADLMYDNHRININVRSLNSKFADIRVKLPPELAEMEIPIRQIALETLVRGKVDIQVNVDGLNDDENICEIDEEIFTRYFNQLNHLTKTLNLDQQNIISALIDLPGVLKMKEFVADEGLKNAIIDSLHKALKELSQHRQTEGQALKTALDESISTIFETHSKIRALEEERMVLVRERLHHHLEQEIDPEKIDNGRFEQELIYYLDKMDIHEEMIRLKQHCSFFLDEMNGDEITKGRKLNFISQEMGREINTIGAKASHTEIQQLVVEMKNELDKIREQLANIL